MIMGGIAINPHLTALIQMVIVQWFLQDHSGWGFRELLHEGIRLKDIHFKIKEIKTMKNTKMKNHAMLALIGISVTLSGSTAFADLAATTQVVPISAMENQMPSGYIINGQQMIFNRLVMPFPGPNGELFLPIKKISEGLGYNVSWDAAQRAVSLSFDGLSHSFSYIKDKSAPTGYVLKDEAGRIYPAKITLGSLYVTPALFTESMQAVVVSDQNNVLRMDAQRHVPDEASTVGEVVSLEQGKDGVQILVKGSAFGKYGHSEISLAVSLTKAVVQKSDGTILKLSELKVGDQIYVKYGMTLTKSMPPMGQAETLVILKDEALTEGKVYFKQASIEKHPGATSIAAPIYQLRVVGTSDYILTLAKDAVITDKAGNKKSFEAIKEGSVVRVYTAQFAAMSYPAQTSAYRIIIQ